MTPEEQLKAIIQAQCDGGYNKFKWLLRGSTIEDDGFGECFAAGESEPIIYILLDTEGCKAAYPTKPEHGYQEVHGKDKWEVASHRILDAWNTGRSINMNNAISTWSKGNDWRAAIHTAYNLLPKDE